MAERPLIRIPDPEPVQPPRPPRGGKALTKPSRDRQAERLAPRFERLARVAGDPQVIAELRGDPQAIAPERAIVFELLGPVPDFYARAAAIGLELLADDEREFAADDDFHLRDDPEAEIAGRIYLAMPDVRALQELLRLWQRYVAGQRMADGFGMWTQLFGLLRDVRPWGPQDRLLPETMAYWQGQLQNNPEAPVRFEVELWFRDNREAQAQAFETFVASITNLGGRVIHRAIIAEIRYAAALVDLPADRVRELLENPAVSLARNDEIMYIRPQTMADYSVDAERADDAADVPEGDVSNLPPIAAILDGYPVQNHALLADRLIIDDPDGFGADYVVAARKHGTEMASLIVHGDINANEPPLTRPVYLRPVMRPVQTIDGWQERTPSDRLLVDLIYRAVVRLKEGEGGLEPIAPSVVIINLSLGDPHRPYAGLMSPWARLLDFLAYRYRVLFVVSAGNVTDPIALPDFQSWEEFERAPIEVRERAVFQAINASRASRTVFSPAEAMNVITVGAAHRDAADPRPMPMGVDPIGAHNLPNVSSALGLGFKKVIKPDILMDGGREYVRFRGNNPHLHVEPVRVSGRAFGLLAASSDPAGIDGRRTALTSGTSGAAALVTRAGHRVYDALVDREGGSLLSDIPDEYIALAIKSLLVHGAAWGERAGLLEEIVGGSHYPKKDSVTRILGHGHLDSARIVECSAGRATLVGYGDVRPGEASLYRVPLPGGLDGVREYRAVTVTVAWFAPINPRHQGYRMAALEAVPGGDPGYSLGVERATYQPHDKAIRRGTVFHDRREGGRASAFVDDGNLLVKVAARATAGEYEHPVPYALVVSLEVGAASEIQVYDEVRAAVDARIRPAITP